MISCTVHEKASVAHSMKLEIIPMMPYGCTSPSSKAIHNDMMEQEVIQMPEAEVPFICNSCFCVLEEFRFKCLSCADFDLCEKV